MYLKDVAEISAGYTFRKRILPDTNGNTFVFQAKDIVQSELFDNVDVLTKTSFDNVRYSNYLHRNDILIVARGIKAGSFKSTVFLSNTSNVVASSSVHVIRITASAVLPEYLSHYLNSKEGQYAISMIVSGSYIGTVPRKELAGLEIVIPTLHKQKAIINLYRNMHQQQTILDRKNQIKQNIINATFKKITTK